MSCITCNSDTGGFIRHNKLLLYIFFPSYSIITKLCQLFPSQKWQPLWPLLRKSQANYLYHLFDLVWSPVLTFHKTIGLHMDFLRGLVEIPPSVCQTVCINDWVAWRPMGNSKVDICTCGWMSLQTDTLSHTCIYWKQKAWHHKAATENKKHPCFKQKTSKVKQY